MSANISAHPHRSSRSRRTARSRIGRLGVFATAVAAVAVVSSGCSLFSSEGAAPEAPVERGAGVLVAVDGWSAQMLPGELRWEFEDRKGSVDLKPATEDDIDELLTRNPGAVTQLVARVITADPRVSCGSDGCEVGGEALDISGLTDLESGPYAEVLAAAGVKAPVQVGFVIAGAGSTVELTAGEDRVLATVGGAEASTDSRPMPEGGMDPEDMDALEELPEVGEGAGPADDDPMFEEDPDTVIDDGPPTAAVVIAAGAGRMFEPVAPWLTGEATEGATPFGVTSLTAFLTPALEELTVPDGDGPLAGGLAEGARTVTADLSTSQLSALTAPTTGCGVGVLCSPTAEGVKIETTASDTVRVCDSKIANPLASEGAPEAIPSVLQMVTRSQVWTLEGGPRNQFGFWDAEPEAPNLLFWPGPAPEVSGEVTRHVRTVELYDGAGRLLDVSGEVTAEGAPWSSDAVIAAHADRFTRCDEAPTAPPAGIGDTQMYEDLGEIEGVSPAE